MCLPRPPPPPAAAASLPAAGGQGGGGRAPVGSGPSRWARSPGERGARTGPSLAPTPLRRPIRGGCQAGGTRSPISGDRTTRLRNSWRPGLGFELTFGLSFLRLTRGADIHTGHPEGPGLQEIPPPVQKWGEDMRTARNGDVCEGGMGVLPGVGWGQSGRLPGVGGTQARKGEAEWEVGQGHSKGRGECWQGGVRWGGWGALRSSE